MWNSIGSDCAADGCRDILQSFDPSTGPTKCELYARYSTCQSDRMMNCGPKSWNHLATTITQVGTAITAGCATQTLPDSVYDECGYGCALVLVSDISQSMFTGFPHFCGSWSLFEECLSRNQCTDSAIASALETLKTTLQPTFQADCTTADCQFTSSKQCNIDIKASISSAVKWETDNWWNRGCVPDNWIPTPQLPGGDKPEDDDQCRFWNPHERQCSKYSCAETFPSCKPKEMMDDSMSEDDNTCQSWFSWGLVCNEMEMSKTCSAQASASCTTSVGHEISGNWNMAATSHHLSMACRGVICDVEAGKQCVREITKKAFKRNLGELGWEGDCLDGVKMMAGCLHDTVMQCSPHAKKLLWPVVKIILFDHEIQKFRRCDNDEDTIVPKCLNEATRMVSLVETFAVSLVDKVVSIDLDKDAVCTDASALRDQLEAFRVDEQFDCPAVKAQFVRIAFRLSQLFDAFCTPKECHMSCAYKCQNELLFWGGTGRLPSWSVLNKMWWDESWDKSDSSDEDWDFGGSSSKSSERPTFELPDLGDRLPCWLAVETEKCMAAATVGCVNENLIFMKEAFKGVKIRVAGTDNCKDPCDEFPCENGGSCLSSPGGTTYTCDCASGYVGDNCEEALCKTHKADACIYAYMDVVFKPMFHNPTSFDFLFDDQGICILTADVTSCITSNVEYCTGDVKFEYNSFKEVVLANIELACKAQTPPCDPIDLNHIGSCFVPGLLATEDLGLTRDVDTGVVSLDRDVLCRAWVGIGKCLIKDDTCSFFRNMYLAVGQYICPSTSCSIERSLECAGGLYDIVQAHPQGVPDCGCPDEAKFCDRYGYYVTCVSQAQISCCSWWREWSSISITKVSMTIGRIEVCADPCNGHECQNGAACEATAADEYTCLCKPGYTGDRCESDICVEHKAMTCFHNFWIHAFDAQSTGDFHLRGLCDDRLLVEVKGCIRTSVEFCPNSIKLRFDALLVTAIKLIEDACSGFELPPLHECPLYEWNRFKVCMKGNFITKFYDRQTQELDLDRFCRADLTCITGTTACGWYRDLTLIFIDIFCPGRPMCDFHSSMRCVETYESHYIGLDECVDERSDSSDEKSEKSEKSDNDGGGKGKTPKSGKSDNEKTPKSGKGDNEKTPKSGKGDKEKTPKSGKSDKDNNEKSSKSSKDSNKDSEDKSSGKSTPSKPNMPKPPFQWNCPACKLYKYGKICVYREVQHCSSHLRNWVTRRFENLAIKEVGIVCNDMCAPNPCQNGGQCYHDFRDHSMDYKCWCPQGYGGKNCDIVTCRPDLAMTCVYKEITAAFKGDFRAAICGAQAKMLTCSGHIETCDHPTWYHWNQTISMFIGELKLRCSSPVADCADTSLGKLLRCASDIFSPILVTKRGMDYPSLDIPAFCDVNKRCIRQHVDCHWVRSILLTFHDIICPSEHCCIKNTLMCIWKFEDGIGQGPDECNSQSSGDTDGSGKGKSKNSDDNNDDTGMMKPRRWQRPCTSSGTTDDMDKSCTEMAMGTCKPKRPSKSDDKCKSKTKDDGKCKSSKSNDEEEEDGGCNCEMYDFDFEEDYFRMMHYFGRCAWGWLDPRCQMKFGIVKTASDGGDDDKQKEMDWWESMGNKRDDKMDAKNKGKGDGSSSSERSRSTDYIDDDAKCRWFDWTKICIVDSVKECSPAINTWISSKVFKKTSDSVDLICNNACLPNPCENGGWCEPNGTDDYVCTCEKGWQGKNCDDKTCKLEKARICMYDLVARVVQFNVSLNGFDLEVVCKQVDTTLTCIEENVVHCPADDQMYIIGFRELIVDTLARSCTASSAPTCTPDDTTAFLGCYQESSLSTILDPDYGLKSLCWGRLQCFFTLTNDCWQLALIKDILIFQCDISGVVCDIKHSLKCIASYAAQAEWQMGEDFTDLIASGALLPKIDPSTLPSIPNIGYDFCLSVQVSIKCVEKYSKDCSTPWGDYLTKKKTKITMEASIDAQCDDPCSNLPCSHGYCEKDGYAPKCTCYPGYTGEFCENEISPCDVDAFKICMFQVQTDLSNIGNGDIKCVEIQASMECISVHSLTCDGFFRDGSMTSYVYMLAAATIASCSFTVPTLPIIEIDVCVSKEFGICTQTAVSQFISETTTTIISDGSSTIIEHEYSACGKFVAASDCLTTIASQCQNSSGDVLRTVEMTRDQLTISIDLHCPATNCKALEAKQCISIMKKAVAAQDGFCHVKDYISILFPTMPDDMPNCEDLCPYIEVTERCVINSISACGGPTKASVEISWRKVKNKLSDQCMSACFPNPCRFQGKCVAVGKDDFFCDCPENHVGQICEIVSETMYNFGPNYGHSELSTIMNMKIDIGRKIQLENNVYDSMYIYASGYLTLDEKQDFESITAFPTHGTKLFAPLLMNQDMSCGGQVFHKIYILSSSNDDHEKDVLNRATSEVRELSTDADINTSFTANIVIVVTWYNMMASPCNYNDKGSTYQMVITANHRLSFVHYIYDRVNVNTDYAYIGWVLDMPHMDEKYGRELQDFQNTKQTDDGKTGSWFWGFPPVDVTPDPSPEESCLNWAESTIDLSRPEFVLPSCPCDLRMITIDQKFMHDGTRGGYHQAKSVIAYTFEMGGTTYSSEQFCSYNTKGNLQNSRPFGVYPTATGGNGLTDEEAFDACCRQSTTQCDRFYSVRPITRCRGYISPLLVLLWGDPHIMTIDKHTYTFNGIGDYIMLRTKTAANSDLPEFELQARMEPIVGGNATVYTGFAVSVYGGFQHVVELDANKEALKLRVNGDAMTPLDKTAHKYDVIWHDKTSLQIIYDRHTDLGIESLSIKTRAGMLDMTPQFTSKFTRKAPVGLMGATSSGFVAKSNVHIPTSEPDCVIFSEFGQTWRLGDESMFPGKLTAQGEGWCGHPCDYNTKLTEAQLLASCGESATCRFDACATGNLTIANATRDIEHEFKNNTNIFENNPPRVSGSKRLHATVGQEVSFTLRIEDDDVMDTWEVFTTNTHNVTAATFDAGLAKFTWTPQDLTPVVISFAAIDSRGAKSEIFEVEVVLCSGCFDNGRCNFEVATGHLDMPNFKIAECECYPTWTGKHCSQDDDGCRSNPCGVGGVCRDIAADDVPAQGQHLCLTCGAGLITVGTKCKVEVPFIPDRAVTDLQNNKLGLVLVLNNLPWDDQYNNVKTSDAIRLINMLEPVLNSMHVVVSSHFRTNIQRFYRGSVAIELQILLTDVTYDDLVRVTQELKDATAGGVRIGGKLYPVKDTRIITPNGNAVSISNDCQFYAAMDMCQNGGFCVMENFSPMCKCLTDTGDAFCGEQDDSTNADLKMIIPVVVISVLFVIGIVIIAVWAVRKSKMNKSNNPYMAEKDTASLAGHSISQQSDISTGKQHGPKIHSWWPGQQPYTGSHA